MLLGKMQQQSGCIEDKKYSPSCVCQEAKKHLKENLLFLVCVIIKYSE